MKNPISIYKSVISKLIYIYIYTRLVSFQKSNRIFYTSRRVSKNEYLFLSKKIFTQFFDVAPCSQPRLSIWTLHNLRRLGSHRRGKQGGDIGEHVGQSCYRKEQVDWICVRWRKSVFENDLYSRLLNVAKNVRFLEKYVLFNDSWKYIALWKIWHGFLEIKKKKNPPNQLFTVLCISLCRGERNNNSWKRRRLKGEAIRACFRRGNGIEMKSYHRLLSRRGKETRFQRQTGLPNTIKLNLQSSWKNK